MNTKDKHISVCICTFKRPDLLRRLLKEVNCQNTKGLFSYSIVVVDNDKMQSAQHAVDEFVANSSVPIDYCVEPEQNIALARNKALEYSKGDFIAFIDDDEIPDRDWLCNLFEACVSYDVDGVLGPVKPYFEHDPPQWVLKGKFFERPMHDSGYKLDWFETRTGNVLLKRKIFHGIDEAFRLEFDKSGEDVDFFRRMMEKGYVFIWSQDAVVFELVPPSRCKSSYLLRRALLRGMSFPNRSSHLLFNLTKSVIAVPLYALSLPILAILGRHLYIRYLIKLVDHSSRILSFLGLKLVRGRDA